VPGSVTVANAAVTEHAIVEGACIPQHKETEEFALYTRRISSFHPRDCWLVFGSLAFISLLTAVVFAMHGAWLIIPFSGLEVLALWLALRWVVRHAGDSESLMIRGDAVTLALREENRTRQYQFNRVWAKVVVDIRARSMRVALRSHGREIEIGRYLGDDGKQALVRELRSRLARR